MEADDEHDHDLPLMSNSRDIHVHHYVLDLTCVFEEKQFKGSITLFCESKIPDEQSEKLVTTIIKEQNDEKVHEGSGTVSPDTLQNVLDQESIDEDLTIDVQTEMASELATAVKADSFLCQRSTSRQFSIKQLHLDNTNDNHISSSSFEMPPFCDKELILLTAETENKHTSSSVSQCYNSLVETQMHPNSADKITTDLYLFPNLDSGSKIEFHLCQNSGTHLSDKNYQGPHESQIGTQPSSVVQQCSFKYSPIQTQIFCHDHTYSADASSENHMLCNAGIETCSEEKMCHNPDVESHNITQVCHNCGANLYVFTKMYQKSGMYSSSETETCYLSGTITPGKEQLCYNSRPDTSQVCHKLGVDTSSNDDSSVVDLFTESEGFCTSGVNKSGAGQLCCNMDRLPPTETQVYNISGVDSCLDTCAPDNAIMDLLAEAQVCQNLGVILSNEGQVCCNSSLNLKMEIEVSHSLGQEVSGKGKLCHMSCLASSVGAQLCHSIGAESSTETHVYCNSGENMSDEAQVCYNSDSCIDTLSADALCYSSGIDTSAEAAVRHNTEELSSTEAQELYNSATDTSVESHSYHNFDADDSAEAQVCHNLYTDKSNMTLASHELRSRPSSSSDGFVSNYSSTHPVTKAEILGNSSADSANQDHTYACQKFQQQTQICKTLMFTKNQNSHTISVDSPINNLLCHSSNVEILGTVELTPDKSTNSDVTIDITDLHTAQKSGDVKASCSKQSKFELESTMEINSSHSTDFHLILDSWNILVDYVEEMAVHDSTSPSSQRHDELVPKHNEFFHIYEEIVQRHDELVQNCDLVDQECDELVQWSNAICKGNNVRVLGSDDFGNGKLVQKNYDNFVRFKDGLSQTKDETVRRSNEGIEENEKLVKRNDEPVQLTKSEFSQEKNYHSKRNDKTLSGNDIAFRESNEHVKESERLARGSDEQVKENKKRGISLIAIRKRLVHETIKNCIKIWKPGVQHAQDFPRIIRIHFTTDPQGSSLKWTHDQDRNECVYTHGHWINNRSLFPSQDVPVAMATWEACIHVEPQYTVLMSGDKEPIITTSNCGLKSYYYHTEMEMPSSTLALAVGKWKEIRLLGYDGDVRMSDIEAAKFYLPCRIFLPSSLQNAAQEVLGRYIPSCMEASASFLGPHPFKRLDVLIVPYSFNSLGMASPSLMFLSQSILSADLMMCVRVAHEMSHSWFGLLIGPQDWTEEWLSEGFCTYTEEYIHCRILKWNEEERLKRFGIRDYLKYRVLKAELHNTDEMFHMLRPNKGQEIILDGSTVQYVKNGMNPEKGFMQVHYLKGYFLLKHLEELVGIEAFHQFLKKFLQHFHGQLITSKDVLELFFSSFSHLRLQGVSTESITEQWLDNPGMPKMICCELQEDNELAQQVLVQVKAFKEFGSKYKSLHWTKRRKQNPEDVLSKLDGDQLVLFLEELLKEENIHHHLLSCLRSFYSLHASNADVLHRWCELVIKHRLQTNYQDVFQFLVNHQAMGVYLFGELVISEDPHQKKLAEACFRKIASDMDKDVRATVHSMLYGS